MQPSRARAVPLLLLLQLLACDPGPDREGRPSGIEEQALYVLFGNPVPDVDDPALFVERGPLPAASATRPSVVLAILDTVRADHLSACGYFRPTSPTLEQLVRRGAWLTCRAYAPADWTLPSHASYFTGRMPVEHGAGWATQHRSEDAAVETGGLEVRPLGPELPTLAEQMARRGYQTVLVSANRLLGDATGLSRGFERALLPPDRADPRRPWVVALLERELHDHVDPARPLFLVLNFLDAHDPWIALPRELEWPGRSRVNVTPDRFAAYFTAFSRGRLVPGGAKALRAQLVDLYDHGVFRADAHLGRALELLESAGRLGRGARLVVTADHGENLIEHGLVRHSLVYEANVRVPLLYWQVGLEEHPALEEPVSAIVAHTLLLEGKPPRPLPPVHSVSVPSPKNRAGEASAPAVAAWSEDDKVLFSGGTWRRFDLKRDPHELDPQPVRDDDPRRSALLALHAELDAPPRKSPRASDQLIEQLKSLGYTE